LTKFDIWTELKLEIVRDYAKEYSKILKANHFHHVYIDAFAGPGLHISKLSGEFIQGSPLNALLIDPPFKEFFFIDIDSEKTDHLRRLVGARKNAHVFPGDCNTVLMRDVFPQVRWEDRRRGLCLLDPYGVHMEWKVVAEAGKLKTIDMFLNFPVMDMNRNSLWRQPEKVRPSDVHRLNSFWGDDSWRKIVYRTEQTLFGPEEEKQENAVVVNAFCRRLKDVAGFKYVARPLPMRNSRRAVVYYLLFASQKLVAKNILEYIFQKYEKRGMREWPSQALSGPNPPGTP